MNLEWDASFVVLLLDLTYGRNRMNAKRRRVQGVSRVPTMIFWRIYSTRDGPASRQWRNPLPGGEGRFIATIHHTICPNNQFQPQVFFSFTCGSYIKRHGLVGKAMGRQRVNHGTNIRWKNSLPHTNTRRFTIELKILWSATPTPSFYRPKQNEGGATLQSSLGWVVVCTGYRFRQANHI